MTTRSTAERILDSSKCLERGNITSEEFGLGAFDRFTHDTQCEPIEILKSLPRDHQAAIIDAVSSLAVEGYSLIPNGDRNKDVQDEYQNHMRRVGEQILSFATGT